jgi:O-antigen/teichoic acid export membrane protein
LAAGLYLLSPELIFILAGSDFEQSIKASQILSPIIILMGLSNVFGIQLLLPYAKEKELLKIFLTGTALSLFLNLILAKSYGYLGSSTATLLTELILTVITFYFAKNIIKLSLPWKYFFGCILFSLLFFPLIHFIREITEDHISILLYSLISCSAVYVGLQVLFFRHYFVDELLTFLRTMLLKKNQ